MAERPDHIPWRSIMGPPEWYEMLDPGIRFAVRVLHAHGIETGQSCQGGVGHAYDRPTVDLYGGAGAEAFAALHHLEAYGLQVSDLSLVWRIDRGLPTENFWRITFADAAEARADERPVFTWGYQAHALGDAVAASSRPVPARDARDRLR